MNYLKTLINDVQQRGDLQRYLIFLVVIVVAFLVGVVIRQGLYKLSHRHRVEKKHVYAAFLVALARSATVLLLSFALVAGFKFLNLPEKYHDIISTSRQILMVFAIGYFVYQLVEVPSIWFENLLEKSQNSNMNKMFIPFIRKSLRLLTITAIIIQIIQILSDKPITTIIAGLGIGSLAIALAAQDTLKHFIGSFVIAGDKPFEIGERIVVDGHDGPVEAIGLRSTSIRTLDGHLVTIPNGELANRTVQNIGKRPFIKRLMNVTITYDTPPEKIKQATDILKKILENHEGMHEDLPPKVYFSDFNSDSLNILVMYWYHPPDYWMFMDFSEKVNFELIKQFNEAGIEFAFPTKTLYLAGDRNRPLDFGLADMLKKEMGEKGERKDEK